MAHFASPVTVFSFDFESSAANDVLVTASKRIPATALNRNAFNFINVFRDAFTFFLDQSKTEIEAGEFKQIGLFLMLQGDLIQAASFLPGKPGFLEASPNPFQVAVPLGMKGDPSRVSL